VLLFDDTLLIRARQLCCLRQASSCSPRYRVGDVLLVLCFELTCQFQALFDSKMVLLAVDSIL